MRITYSRIRVSRSQPTVEPTAPIICSAGAFKVQGSLAMVAQVSNRDAACFPFLTKIDYGVVTAQMSELGLHKNTASTALVSSPDPSSIYCSRKLSWSRV
jgi:hypothetical protein